MILPAALLALVSVIGGFVAIEKKRRAAGGVLTYPIWRCNLWFLWACIAAACALVTGSVNIPRFVGIAFHDAGAAATVTRISAEEHCRVTYGYQVEGAAYTGEDSLCGVKQNDTHPVHYNKNAPEDSTLYPPGVALKNEIIAVTLISVALAAAIVLWFRATYIVGRPEKP